MYNTVSDMHYSERGRGGWGINHKRGLRHPRRYLSSLDSFLDYCCNSTLIYGNFRHGIQKLILNLNSFELDAETVFQYALNSLLVFKGLIKVQIHNYRHFFLEHIFIPAIEQTLPIRKLI